MKSLKCIRGLLSFCIIFVSCTGYAFGVGDDVKYSIDDAERIMREGHGRVMNHVASLHNLNAELPEMSKISQHAPVAVVLSCADARAPIEIIFDQGVGDLFVLRVAGNVASTEVLASAEYAIAGLKTPLIIVLGHTDCGAIKAAVQGKTISNAFCVLMNYITRNAKKVKKENPGLSEAEVVKRVTEENVRSSMRDLVVESEIIADAVERNECKIVGGIYDIETGEIRWLD